MVDKEDEEVMDVVRMEEVVDGVYLGEEDSFGVVLHGEEEVEPRPGDVVVLQRGHDQRELVDVLDVLLFAALVRHFHRHFRDFDVNEQLVLLRPFLQHSNTR